MAGKYLRRLSRTLPAGNATTYEYYGEAEARTNPCPGGASANQAGRLRKTISPDPDGAGPQPARVDKVVYDASGRVVATVRYQVGSVPAAPDWTCTTYESVTAPATCPSRPRSTSWGASWATPTPGTGARSPRTTRREGSQPHRRRPPPWDRQFHR